jgi:DNA sulfur modification protein DndC
MTQLILSEVITPNGLEHELSGDNGNRLESLMKESAHALATVVERGFDHWVLTFSGGKDSTATVVLALETALWEGLSVKRIDIVYSDTLIEIPVIQHYALKFLGFLADFERLRSLPLYFHVVRPALEERFWVCLLGKGYPPPHQRFRWCTRRLKIDPVEARLRDVIQLNRTAIVTGVRFGESDARDRQLYASCRRGGECGQGAWFQYSRRLQAAYLAPLAYWRECNVWDFLNFVAPQWGYPTHLLERNVYNGRGTRFGCWMCTVVRQDKAMEKITSLPQWSHLRPLIEFREHVLRLTSSLESRYHRPNGQPGRLTLETRKQLLYEILQLQERLGFCLINDEEIRYIKKLWADPKYGKYEEDRK